MFTGESLYKMFQGVDLVAQSAPWPQYLPTMSVLAWEKVASEINAIVQAQSAPDNMYTIYTTTGTTALAFTNQPIDAIVNERERLRERLSELEEQAQITRALRQLVTAQRQVIHFMEVELKNPRGYRSEVTLNLSAQTEQAFNVLFRGRSDSLDDPPPPCDLQGV